MNMRGGGVSAEPPEPPHLAMALQQLIFEQIVVICCRFAPTRAPGPRMSEGTNKTANLHVT